MTEKLPAPCDPCRGTGMHEGSECHVCRGKGYYLFLNTGNDVSVPLRPEKPQRPRPMQRQRFTARSASSTVVAAVERFAF